MAFFERMAISFAFLALFGLGSCQSGTSEMSARLKDDSYPDLLKIPETPKVIKTDKEWSAIAKELTASEKSLRKNRLAADYDAEYWDTQWSNKARIRIENNPKNGEVPNMDEALDWAARMRAIMDKHQ